MTRQYLFFTIMYNTEHAHDRSQGCLSYFNIFRFTLPAQQYNNVLFRHILEFVSLLLLGNVNLRMRGIWKSVFNTAVHMCNVQMANLLANLGAMRFN